MKKQSGDPFFRNSPLDRAHLDLHRMALNQRDVMYGVSKTELNFEEQSQKVYDLVHDQLRPALKKMTGRYYQKMLDDMTTIEKLVDELRREARNLGI